MKNLLVLTHIATNIPESVELTDSEMVLAKDKSKTINESWWKLCESVKERTGLVIEGNFELESLGGRPLH